MIQRKEHVRNYHINVASNDKRLINKVDIAKNMLIQKHVGIIRVSSCVVLMT